MKFSVLVLSSFILMEPFTAFMHRFVMHSLGWIWHKSHHDRVGKVVELNDLYPIVFSVFAIGLFIAGMNNYIYTAIGVGVTLYGAAYFVVHEIIIHSRIVKLKSNNVLYRYWRFGHNVHHQYNNAPYGFIIPITPKELSNKARAHPRNLITRFP